MANHTHVTAPTQFVEANGIRYAYRRFGAERGTPLVLLQHFRGGLDHWDPLVTDGLAQGRPVILINNAGVASSSGETPDTIDALGDHVAVFVAALGLAQVDVLGFSIGGYIAQSFVLRHPQKVRRLVLVGTGPRNGERPTDPRIPEAAGHAVPTREDYLFLFFSPSAESQAAGKAFWERRHQRKDVVHDAPRIAPGLHPPCQSTGPESSRGYAPVTVSSWAIECPLARHDPSRTGWMPGRSPRPLEWFSRRLESCYER